MMETFQGGAMAAIEFGCAVPDCGGAVTHNGDHAKFPYCRGCYYNGRAFTHRLGSVADEFARRTGGRLWVDQTGGGCQTVTVGPESGGWCAGLALVHIGDDDDTLEYEAVGAWFYDDDPDWDGDDVTGVHEIARRFSDDGNMVGDLFIEFAVAVWPLIVDFSEEVRR